MTAHGSIAQRDYTQVQIMLRQRSISQRAISEDSGCSLATVNRALNRRHFHRIAYGDMFHIRRTIEKLLNATVDWAEYDAGLNL